VRFLVAGLACLSVAGAAGSAIVDLHDVSPRILVEIRYATENNFLHKKVYDTDRCRLRPSVAGALARVQADLEPRGLGLKVFDCYRPPAVQKLLWAALPDARYVADPAKGSRHNRGAAVDIALVDKRGRALPMPSAYDEFTERAHRDFTGGTESQRANRALLDETMSRHGFVGLPTEWWHFDAAEWQTYPIADEPL